MSQDSSTSVAGVDVSHYQGAVDWFAVRASGVAFAFAKASEGLSIIDPQFSTNWSGIKEAGLYRGAYHFGHPGTDADAQALHFHSIVGELSWRDLPPVLDIETSDGHPAADVVQWVLRFVTRAESLFARPVTIYTGGFWRNKLGDPLVAALTTRPLWIANYRAGAPLLPRTWANWTFWQFSDGSFGQPGPVPGIRGPCDRNRYAGDLAQLEALTTLTLPPLQSAPPVPQGSWPGTYLLWPSRPVLSGDNVRTWQQRMQALGYPLGVDGVYGPGSKAACMSFQRDHGLNVDGIVGPQTWQAAFG